MRAKICCVVGFGYWGPNVVRNIKASSNFKLLYLVEPNELRIEAYKKMYGPDLVFFSDIEQLPDNVEVAFVCSSTESHHKVVEYFLRRDIDVYCEKPFGVDVASSKRLFKFAENKNLAIWINYPYLFHPAILEVDRLLQQENESLGPIRSIKSERSNFSGRIMSVDVVRDLMIHDFSILRFLFGSLAFSEYHVDVLSPLVEIQSQVIFFGRHELGFGVSFFANHNSPVKQRRFELNAENGGICFDENQMVTPLQILRNQREVDKAPESREIWNYSLADVESPHLRFAEPLQKSIENFASYLEERDLNQHHSSFRNRVISVSRDTTYFVGYLYEKAMVKK